MKVKALRPRALCASAARPALAAGLCLVLLSLRAGQGLCGDSGVGKGSLELTCRGSFWWLVDEEVENGLYQNGSMDPADDAASGFSFHSGRLALDWRSGDGRAAVRLQLRLDDRTDLLDFYGSWEFRPWLRVFFGQMRIPSTAEGMTSPLETDFISRSTFARHVCDYSLSRTPYISSVMAVRSYDRDAGVALKGEFAAGGERSVSYFLMVSNGIGGGSYIGGREDEGFVYTNSFGDYYYGGRIEAVPVEGLTLGAHLSRNIHEDVALGDRGPVLDFDRKARTADLQAEVPGGGRIYAFYGSGDMDDYSLANEYRFEYEGWGVSMVQPLPLRDLELCCRFDRFETRYRTGSVTETQDDMTFGLNWSPREDVRILLDYVIKDTESEAQPDLDDDILYLDVRFDFDWLSEI